MNKIIVLSILLILTAAAGGCGSDDVSRAERRTDAEKQQALRDSQFGSTVEALDKARAVEQLSLDRKDKLDDALK